MGTPEFAVPSLQKLISENYNIRLVVTQPDRPKGRGQKLSPPPIKVLAEQHGIPVLQPGALRKDVEARSKILGTACDFLVVVAFGQILPKEILDHPKLAPLNVHASLLPAYRGAAPIARAIIEGETETGVTIQWMTEALDMGDILHQKKTLLQDTESAGELHDRMKLIGAEALLESLEMFKEDRVTRIRQDPRVGSYADKLKKQEAQISFHAPAERVHRQIMGLNPWPVAECRLMGQRLRLLRSRFVPRRPDADPGTVVDVSDDEIIVSCADACVAILELQQENRRRITTREFLQGHSLPKGLVLGGQTS